MLIKNSIFEVNDLINCTSCGMCVAICPNSAISFSLDENGFYRPSVNESMCVSCGMCKKYCYRFDKNIFDTNRNYIHAYSGITNNKTLLSNSSSGGISEEIMKECISKGYTIVGVEYDYNNNIAKTTICNSVNNLSKYRGSKYMQSYTVDALKKIILNKKEKYAVFGTPCQIYSIKKYVDSKKLNNILLIDIFCHGVPSYFLWSSYLKSKNICLEQIDFRTKDYGWHNYSIKMRDVNGKTILSKKMNDPFFDLFFSKLCFNTACYTCKLRSTLAYTDIRIGDYWGPKFNNNYTGVSAIVTYSIKGSEIVNDISEKINIQSSSFEDIVKYQSYGKNHYYNKSMCKEIIANLKDNKLDNAYTLFKRSLTKKKKIIRIAKNIFKCMPKKIQFFLRGII